MYYSSLFAYISMGNKILINLTNEIDINPLLKLYYWRFIIKQII
jgi:hypothetical protein